MWEERGIGNKERNKVRRKVRHIKKNRPGWIEFFEDEMTGGKDGEPL